MITRTLHIQRAGSAGVVKSTKTGQSRKVDVTPRLAAALDTWQAVCEADALVRGTEPGPWIFTTAEGRLLERKRVAKKFRALLRQAALPRFRLYDLRHSFASHLLAENAPITYVAAQLGHKKPTTTLLHYAHWIPTGDKGWIDRLARHRESTALSPESWHQDGTKGRFNVEGTTEVTKKFGEPSGDRTQDPLIKRRNPDGPEEYHEELSDREVSDEVEP